MLLVSQNIGNYEINIPKDTVFRINMAWCNSISELKEKLERVLGLAVPTATAASRSEDFTDTAQPSPIPSVSETAIPSTDADEDDNMSYFEKLANDV